MGRHYDGDIEGKFWFGVQDSSDAEYFGAEDITELQVTEDGDDDYHTGFTDYLIPFTSLEIVKDAIELCKRELTGNYLIIDEFFTEHASNGYNDEMLIKYYKDTRGIVINEAFLRSQMQIYARLGLGMQILIYFNENPGKDCNFTAEM